MSTCSIQQCEKMLVQGYKGVKEKFKTLSPRMVEALQQVVGNSQDTFLDMIGSYEPVLSILPETY